MHIFWACLAYFIEYLYNVIIDDEYDDYVQAHQASSWH